MRPMSRKRFWLAGIAAAGAVALAGGGAQGGADAGAAAIPPLYQHPGKILAGNCFQCHGTDGKNGAFDSLAGESAGELYSELKELQTTTEIEEAIMRIHALGYSDAQLHLIADYFASVR